MSLFRRLVGIKWGILLAGVRIAFYTILVGANAAVVRAATMGGIIILLIELNGWIHLSTDWEDLWVEVERGTP